MNSRSTITSTASSTIGNISSCVFGVLFFAAGIVNMFWGNDALFGVFIAGLSLLFFPPVTDAVKRIMGFGIPLIVKILVALFIIWATLGVGELFDKINLMLQDLR